MKHLSTFAIVGLTMLCGLLYHHSNILMIERDSARTERDTFSAQVVVAAKHEQELQESLKVGEENRRKLAAKYDKAQKDIHNAKPNDCTDAPVSPDIDGVLRGAAATSHYPMPGSAISTRTASAAAMGRKNESGRGAVLHGESEGCAGV